MKKYIKNNLKVFITIIVTTIVVGSIGVYADYKYSSNEVSYKDGSVKEAIDDLYSKVLYKPGDVIYYDPVENTTCTNYTSDNSLNETKIGCLKWYVIADYKNSVAMILDHNTTYRKAWNTDNKNVSYEESDIKADVDALKTESGWALQPRLITALEVANITGNTIWANANNTGSWFCLGTNKVDKTTWPYCESTTNNKYAWLFDYTKDCTLAGCNREDQSSGYAYWTSTTYGTAGSGSSMWFVLYFGSLMQNLDAHTASIGVRPVITISKSIIS